MLISAVRYTRGLDLEARVFAETTGIAIGWLAANEVFRCGCWVCEFVVEKKFKDSKDKTEKQAHKEFFELVRAHLCLHWPKYLRYRANPNEEVHLARQTLKRADDKSARLAKLVEPPPWELEEGADKLPEEGVELEELLDFDLTDEAPSTGDTNDEDFECPEES